MSAILSADDLNDFISPGVACIKPVETLPKQQPTESSNPYEVQREDKVPESAANAPPAQISLTDCLACSGCVTSAEAVLVSLQSHEEVSNTLDRHTNLVPDWLSQDEGVSVDANGDTNARTEGKLFIASVSPQTRASIAATYGTTEREAGYMIEQFLSGPQGLQSVSSHGSSFTWVIDTNNLRDICLAGVVEEAIGQKDTSENQEAPRRPILSSACPGWICYAEKTHPHVLPHLSSLRSPQAMSGTLMKSVLSRAYGIDPSRVWHLAVMPCFDKKLEASREELTDIQWQPEGGEKQGIRDTDCVITARELIMLAELKGISLPDLPRHPVHRTPFPDRTLDRYLFPRGRRRDVAQSRNAGPSGGWAYQILRGQQRQLPGSEIRIERGRNADIVEYILQLNGEVVAKTARYFGFRNIQNLVRKLKPPRKSAMPSAAAVRRTGADLKGASANSASMDEYVYIEVMACPGGCTNGGGQIKFSDVVGEGRKSGPVEQKQWLRQVDEAYYSGDETDDRDTHVGNTVATGQDDVPSSADADEDRTAQRQVEECLQRWISLTGLPLSKLLFTTYRRVESDVGKSKGKSDTDRVAGLASSIGGGW